MKQWSYYVYTILLRKEYLILLLLFLCRRSNTFDEYCIILHILHKYHEMYKTNYAFISVMHNYTLTQLKLRQCRHHAVLCVLQRVP